MARVLSERYVQAHVVGLLEQLVEVDETHTQLPRPLRRGVESPGDHFHAEGFPDACHLGTDVPGADDAEDLTPHTEIHAPRPLVGANLGGLEGGALGHREQQAEHVLGHDRRRTSGLVRHDDAQLPRRRQVDHVRADRAGCDHPQIGERAQFLLAPGDGTARVDDHLEAAGPLDLLGLVGGTGRVQGEFAVRLQAVELGGTGDLRRVVAGYQDVDAGGHGTADSLW